MRLAKKLGGVAMAVLASLMGPVQAEEAPIGFIRMEDRVFRAVHDGSEQRYVLLIPKGFAPQKDVTLLVALHGHGSDRWQFVRNERGECRATREAAAAEGMLMVAPDYRARTSWMGPAAEADLVQILRTLRTAFPVSKTILCGGSMGAASALTFTALHPDLVDGVVALNGTANHLEYKNFQDAITASFGGNKVEKPLEYRKRSAEFHPNKFRMPIAATTGGKDTSVPPESIFRLVKAIGEHNRHVLHIHRPTGGHQTTYEDTRQALRFVVEALKKHHEAEPAGE